MTDLKPCPFCGGTVDPKGWLSDGGLCGPECEGCGCTACSVEEWQKRVEPEIIYEADVLAVSALRANPRDMLEFYAHSPNLFRTLAQRLAEFSIYMKVSLRMVPEAPIEEESIGPDVARASVLLTGMAEVIEEGPDDE